MISVETTTLTQLINDCFDLSMDGRLSQPLRTDFLVVGKRLRGTLLNLLSARFKDGTQAVIDANNEIKAVTRQIAAEKVKLDKTAAALQSVADLVAVLDDLLKVAASFA